MKNLCVNCKKEFDTCYNNGNKKTYRWHKNSSCYECKPYQSREDINKKGMRKCNFCMKDFIPVTYYNGKRIRLPQRVYCFECLPYEKQKKGCHPNLKNTPDGLRKCKECGEYKNRDEFPKIKNGKFLSCYCKPCGNKICRKPKNEFKQKCVDYKGGECIRCGYKECLGALEFHHRDNKTKDINIGEIRRIDFNDAVKSELDKCDLLCSNCHRTIHYKYY